jgi:hypothetical protein
MKHQDGRQGQPRIRRVVQVSGVRGAWPFANPAIDAQVPDPIRHFDRLALLIDC